MCSRYEINARPAALKRRFQVEGEIADLARISPTGGGSHAEVRPTDPAPIVVADASGARRIEPARFGLSVSWDDAPLINARAETLLTKPTFRPLIGNRCLVPATAYIEWRRDGDRRHRNRIAPVGETEGEALMGFAGLHDDGRFVIVTCAPAAAVAHVHDRMPVILPPEAWEFWLDAGLGAEQVLPLLTPFAALAAIEAPAPSPRQGALF